MYYIPVYIECVSPFGIWLATYRGSRELMVVMKVMVAYPLGVQSPWTDYAFISIPDGALDFKQHIGASGITWSSKRLDNIHIHLFMPERFGLQAEHRSEWHHLEFKALG